MARLLSLWEGFVTPNDLFTLRYTVLWEGFVTPNDLFTLRYTVLWEGFVTPNDPFTVLWEGFVTPNDPFTSRLRYHLYRNRTRRQAPLHKYPATVQPPAR